ALEGLNGLLLSESKYRELPHLIDSLAAADLPGAVFLYFLDVFAGAPFDSEAVATANRLRKENGEQLAGIRLQNRWLVATWYARHNDSSAVEQLRPGLV